jgi:hypothetical protein
MENISQLVDSSLARHGVATNFDHLRLQWSSWFRCESSFSVLLAPAKPGIFALGEEIVPSAGAASKRMLALFHVSEADDLGMALGRLFLPGTALRDRLTSGRCFARYTVIEDSAQRRLATEVFQRWMQDSAETASGIGSGGAETPVRSAAVETHADKASNGDASGSAVRSSSKVVEINKPSTSFAWGMEVQEREAEELKHPQPLPSGF